VVKGEKEVIIERDGVSMFWAPITWGASMHKLSFGNGEGNMEDIGDSL
jgi:hypothetical protein